MMLRDPTKTKFVIGDHVKTISGQYAGIVIAIMPDAGGFVYAVERHRLRNMVLKINEERLEINADDNDE